MTTSNGQGLTGSVSFTWTISIPADAGPAGAARLDLGGKCLNDVGNSSANGTQADIWTCNGSSAQQWTYVQDGTLRIHAKCLTVPSGAAGDLGKSPVSIAEIPQLVERSASRC